METFALSADGEYLSFIGKDGYIILVSRKSKQWIANLKMNGTVRAICHSSNNKLYSLGGKLAIEVTGWKSAYEPCFFCLKVMAKYTYGMSGSGNVFKNFVMLGILREPQLLAQAMLLPQGKLEGELFEATIS